MRHARRADWRAGDGLRERRAARAERAVGGGTREGSGAAREREAWWKARGWMRGAASARRARRRAGREGMAGAAFRLAAGSSKATKSPGGRRCDDGQRKRSHDVDYSTRPPPPPAAITTHITTLPASFLIHICSR